MSIGREGSACRALQSCAITLLGSVRHMLVGQCTLGLSKAASACRSAPALAAYIPDGSIRSIADRQTLCPASIERP
jgi:hypothetical protein